MDKNILLLLTCIVNCFAAIADTPGKAKMHESKVSFQNVKQLKDYTFYYDFNYGDNHGAITADTSLIIPPSGGAPDGFIFWGINNRTKKSTDTILFSNYYAADAVIILSAVKNDSIQYSNTPLSNANEILSEGNTDNISNKQLIADAKKAKQNHYIKVGLFSLAGAAALGGLIWFFLRRRKKKEQVA
jgi:LPXTG-motif cell wall-anchored protein